MGSRLLNRLHCCGRWSAATPPLVEAAGTGDWSVVRVARGLWDVLMDIPIDTTERITFVQSRTASTMAMLAPRHDADTVFRVICEGDDGTLVDSAIDFLVVRTEDSEAMRERRWAADCNAMRLDAARMDWLGRRANRLGWVGASVLAEARRRA